MSDITRHTDGRQALAAIKQRIQSAQTRAVLAVNTRSGTSSVSELLAPLLLRSGATTVRSATPVSAWRR